MSEPPKRSTIDFEPELHQALRFKAASTNRTISDLVNEAVRLTFQDDQADLATFDEREPESTMTYEELLNDLNGIL
ncbi:CopG family transcriptional regulator [Acaryochloris sp. IP29b_bin.148]|uniref:CopG family transcriptional regulator n=1 Tax=Acaryochloris sp. IP29b_bin.148 TaxID=2969218 RepID=UPI002604F48E|nr:CopG family transcriptional regulator [Acaryochloris sp. IP29b_bin.148]